MGVVRPHVLEGGLHVSRALAVWALVSWCVDSVDIAVPTQVVEKMVASDTIDLFTPFEISLTYQDPPFVVEVPIVVQVPISQ